MSKNTSNISHSTNRRFSKPPNYTLLLETIPSVDLLNPKLMLQSLSRSPLVSVDHLRHIHTEYILNKSTLQPLKIKILNPLQTTLKKQTTRDNIQTFRTKNIKTKNIETFNQTKNIQTKNIQREDIRHCISCMTKTTPMWRGRLCNACGIRYQRHGILRCSTCHVECKCTSSPCEQCVTGVMQIVP